MTYDLCYIYISEDTEVH